MNFPQEHLAPLGDFLPSDVWQTHINNIFYGTKGPAIHGHFQTYVSLDYRLAHTLADHFFAEAVESSSQEDWTILEWGVGNGNLAARFLNRLEALDTEGRVYPRLSYVLCDYSEEILKGVQANPNLQNHAERYSTVRLNAEQPEDFQPDAVHKIISNEIWDDLATKVLLKSDGLFYEEYLQPMLDPGLIPMDADRFLTLFADKDLDSLKECPPFLENIYWERSFQRVDISDWVHAEVIARHMQEIEDGIPTPINVGAFATLKRARELLGDSSLGYCSFDYGMLSMDQLNFEGRPYFKLYGGQYTAMVNFPLLVSVAQAIGFSSVELEAQHAFVGNNLGEDVTSLLELVQAHPKAGQWAPWDADILMLQTLHALNSTYKSPYTHKLDYPPMPDTPKKQRKLISQLAAKLSPRGVPDTVAYVTRSEVYSAMKSLRKLGYREKDLQAAFQPNRGPIVFGHMQVR